MATPTKYKSFAGGGPFHNNYTTHLTNYCNEKVKLLLFALMMLMMAPVSAQTKYTVPVSGRKVKLWVSDKQVLSLSSQEYESYLKTAKISTDATNTALVKK